MEPKIEKKEILAKHVFFVAFLFFANGVISKSANTGNIASDATMMMTLITGMWTVLLFIIGIAQLYDKYK